MKKKIASRFAESTRAYCRKVIGLADSPQKIAAGVALGLAFDFLPVPVISIPLAYLAARLVRCNAAAAVATVIFFKLAVPFFFTMNIVVGNSLFGNIPGPDIAGGSPSIPASLLEVLADHGYSFLAGSLVNAAVAGVAVYFLLVFLLERKRNRKGA